MALRVTLTSSLSPPDAEEYDRFLVEARGAHYAQSRSWLPVARAGRFATAKYFLARDGGRIVGCGLLLQPRAAFVAAPVASLDRGPVCDDPERVAEVARALCRAARRRGIVRVHVMPYFADDEAEVVERALPSARFASVQKPDGSHVRTLRVSVAGRTDAEILAGGERRALRTELKQAERLGVRARLGTSADLPTLARLHRELMAGQGKGTKPATFFERLSPLVETGDAGLFVCEHEGEVASAILVVRHGKTATFILGASDQKRRRFTKMAPPLLRAIQWARENGCAIFDLGGIPIEGDADEKRANIARFKLDFTQTPVRLVGEHARWL